MKFRFVSDWKNWPKWWSTWFELAATMFFGYVAAVPDAVLKMWALLPTDVRAAVDPQYIQFAGIALIAIGSFCKVVEQMRLKNSRGRS